MEEKVNKENIYFIYVYNWITFLHSRNKHNIVNKFKLIFLIKKKITLEVYVNNTNPKPHPKLVNWSFWEEGWETYIPI